MTTQKPILIACILIAFFALPLASAGLSTVERTINPSVPLWQTGSQTNVDPALATSTLTLFANLGTCLSSCYVYIDVKPGCTGTTINEYNMMAATTIGARITTTFLGGDCFWTNVSGGGGSPNFNGRSIWVNVTKADFEGQTHANLTRLEMNETRTAQNDIQNATANAAYATFEGREHANLTRLEMNATRTAQNDIQNATAAATYEGQAHANATWCPLPCAPGEGNFVGNQWFNETWRWNPIFGNVTALSLSVGWTNTSELDVLGNVTLVTEADPYLPMLIFGGAAVFFFYFVAWLPAIIALANMGNHLLETPLWGLPASAMFLAVGIGIHVAVTRNIIPAPWGRRETKREG